jgi:glycerol-3-phosphate dehydrogenase (NAD(P)+)
MRIAVLGAGSWGTALAILLAEAGHEVALWGRDPQTMGELARLRENLRYLPGHRLPPTARVTSALAEAVAGASMAVLATPSPHIREIAGRAAAALPGDAVLVCASKGLEEGTHLTLDRVIEAAAPDHPVVLLSGPTFAVEIAAGLPAAAVAASRDLAAAAAVQRVIGGERLRLYTTEDVVGVAVGGALKNVIAIAAGCSDGLGFGHNARAALITRGLHEIGRLATRLGANPLTLSGLAGLGDLVLTCTGALSRNRRVGLALAAGELLGAITTRLGQVAEGIQTAHQASALAAELGIEMPVTAQVTSLLAGTQTARAAVAALLAREQGHERG